MIVAVVLVGVGVVLLAGVGTLLLAVRWWSSAAPHEALIVHRMSGEPRVVLGGALVLPVVQKAERIDLRASPVTITRRDHDAVICGDRARVEVEAIFTVEVEPTVESILRVVRSIGCARSSQPQTLADLFTAAFSEAIKDACRAIDRDALLADPARLRAGVLERLAAVDLHGYRVDDVAITRLTASSHPTG